MDELKKAGPPGPQGIIAELLQAWRPMIVIVLGMAVGVLPVYSIGAFVAPIAAEMNWADTQVIGWALAQLGTPYTYGGDCTAAHSGTPRRQCDCSSLMQQAYRAAGVTIGRTTRDQVNEGTPVPGAAQLHPGDLILIPGSDGTRSDPRHVGMFIGSDLIVQAPKTGDVVRISKLSGWANQVAAIRRIVPS